MRRRRAVAGQEVPEQERSPQLAAPRPGADRRGRVALLIHGGGKVRSKPPARDREPRLPLPLSALTASTWSWRTSWPTRCC